MQNTSLPPKEQAGVALIEALVSMLIFAVGLLALLGLQTLGIKAANDGKYRADAAYLANQLVSQMWAEDRNNLSGYNYNCTSGSNCTFACGGGSSSGTAPAPLQSWLNQLSGHFPTGATSQVMVVTVPPSAWQTSATYQVAVSICWRMPGDPTGQYHNYVTSAQIS